MARAPEQPDSTRQAIKQIRPFRSLRHEAMIALLLTSETLRWRVQQLLSEHGDLTHQQYNVLRILRGAGEDGLPTLEIAERMIERTPGVTRLIDRLEGKGLVRRERSAKDRRQVFCVLTAGGLDLLARLDRPIDDLDEQLLEGLDDGSVRDLISKLDLIRQHVRRLDPEPTT